VHTCSCGSDTSGTRAHGARLLICSTAGLPQLTLRGIFWTAAFRAAAIVFSARTEVSVGCSLNFAGFFTNIGSALCGRALAALLSFCEVQCRVAHVEFQACRRVVRLVKVAAVSCLLNDQHPGRTCRRQDELENFPCMWCAEAVTQTLCRSK
jgi:hypothetical protein